MDKTPVYDRDVFGHITIRPDTTGMMFPVRCAHCRQVYDSANVTVIAQYADCSVWISPCCNRQVDDRLFKGMIDIEKLY